MKLAFYIGSLNRGGAERVISNLAEFFYGEGCEAVMVTKFKAKEEYIINSNIKRIIADITDEEETDSRIGNFVARVNKLRRIWKEEKPDIIISFINKNNFMAILSSMFLRTKVVVSVRSAPEREYKSRLERILAFLLFRIADGVVLQTQKAFGFFPKAIRKKAICLQNSLSSEFIGETYKGERTKEIVTVGRIDDNKNQIMLVKAFESIMDRFPEWTCSIYGDGEGMPKVKAYINENNLCDRIKLKGRVSNVRDNIQQSSVFVLPSKVEGMPNALIEAMALGLAVISTDCPCGGPGELIEHGKNGLLVKVDDVQELADAMVLLLDNEELRKSMGKDAEQIQTSLNPDKVNSEWKALVDRLVG